MKLSIVTIIKGIERIRWCNESKKLYRCGYGSKMEMFFVLHGAKRISLGKNVHCERDCELSVWMDSSAGDAQIIVADDVTMARGCFVSCTNRVEIDSGCLFGANVFVTDNYHGQNRFDELSIPPNDRGLYSKGPVKIGKNVWLGRNVSVMPNVTIGDNAIIGTNAVVTHDIPASSVAGGVPAKVIKTIGVEDEKTLG